MSLPPVGAGVHLEIRVLLVEDVPVIARIVEQMLTTSSHCRYHIAWRKTLASALEEVQARDFDTVLLDLNLPDSDDLSTLARMREAAPTVPVVVLTATDDDNIGLQAVQSGAQDYLIKGQCSAATLDRSIVYSIERQRLQQTLRQLAVVDELTGLYNRRGFNTLNPDLFQQLREGTAHAYLACFDLDRFKQINDTHGHAAGDSALVEFATLLRSVFRKEGLFARLGGDEFLAMGIETHPGSAVESLELLEQQLKVRNAVPSALFRLESSVGLLLLDRNERRPLDELLAAADAELYRHKQARKAGRPVSLPNPQPQMVPIVSTGDFHLPWEETLHRLRLACVVYDPELGGHHARVAETAAAIARRLGLPPERVERVRLAAGIHDVGKIGIHRRILNRRGRLREREVEIVRGHTRAGHRLLDGSEWPELRCAADVALRHHEGWDGRGYPDGLRGEAISLEARIVAVADVYDAMRSERTYKEAWTDERVIAEMTGGRGTQFDPEVFDAFLAEFAAPGVAAAS